MRDELEIADGQSDSGVVLDPCCGAAKDRKDRTELDLQLRNGHAAFFTIDDAAPFAVCANVAPCYTTLAYLWRTNSTAHRQNVPLRIARMPEAAGWWMTGGSPRFGRAAS